MIRLPSGDMWQIPKVPLVKDWELLLKNEDRNLEGSVEYHEIMEESRQIGLVEKALRQERKILKINVNRTVEDISVFKEKVMALKLTEENLQQTWKKLNSQKEDFIKQEMESIKSMMSDIKRDIEAEEKRFSNIFMELRSNHSDYVIKRKILQTSHEHMKAQEALEAMEEKKIKQLTKSFLKVDNNVQRAEKSTKVDEITGIACCVINAVTLLPNFIFSTIVHSRRML